MDIKKPLYTPYFADVIIKKGEDHSFTEIRTPSPDQGGPDFFIPVVHVFNGPSEAKPFIHPWHSGEKNREGKVKVGARLPEKSDQDVNVSLSVILVA